MNHTAPGTSDQTSGQSIGKAAKAIVEEFLRIIMIPDPDGARAFVAPELEIHFTGDRLMRDPRECSAFNASRYKWVKKRFERTDVVADASLEEAIVYNIGTLYGQWPDGEPFEGNRYVDRYVVRHGKIIRMEVWNDSAERMLLRVGLCSPWFTSV
jgi:ketosteroid isomerase-like protein